MGFDKSEWQRKNTTVYYLRLQNSGGIPAALQTMTESTGISANQYIREALVQRLCDDGYIEMEEVVIKKIVPKK